MYLFFLQRYFQTCLLYECHGLSCILRTGRHLGPVIVIEDVAKAIASYIAYYQSLILKGHQDNQGMVSVVAY